MTNPTHDPFAQSHKPVENASTWWKALAVGDCIVGRIVRDFTIQHDDGARRSLELAPAVALARKGETSGYETTVLDAVNVNVNATMVAPLARFRVGDLIGVVYAGETDTGKPSKMRNFTLYKLSEADMAHWLGAAGRSDLPF